MEEKGKIKKFIYRVVEICLVIVGILNKYSINKLLKELFWDILIFNWKKKNLVLDLYYLCIVYR